MWTLSRRIDTSVPLSLDGYDILVEEQFARIHEGLCENLHSITLCVFISYVITVLVLDCQALYPCGKFVERSIL